MLRRVQFLLTVVAVAFFPALAGAQAISITGTEHRLTADPGDQYDPHISGNLVVFTDFRVNSDVYYVDLATMLEHPVAVTPGNQELTAVSGGRIAYTDYRTADIVVFDTADGTTTNITAADKAAAGRLFNSVDPAISGGLVAWMDTRDGNVEIYAKDLATGEERRLTDAPEADQKPAVSGTIVVWERCVPGQSGTCDVWTYDWSTGATRQLTDTPSCNERTPDIDGQKVVFQDDCGGDNDIVAYDLATAIQTRLALAGDQALPQVSGDFVSFDDLRTGVYHIGLWYVPTGQTFEVTSGGAGQYLSGIDGHRVVYTDDRNGDLDVYMYEFEVTGADTLPPSITGASDVTVDATSPAGAHVVLPVAATDNVDPAPVLSCSSPLDATFPIGTTPVQCTATDASGNNAQASFSVHVRGAVEQLQALSDLVESLNLRHGIENSLDAKLDAALRALDAARCGAAGVACGALEAFVAEVEAQAGKALSSQDAAALVEAAERIEDVLACADLAGDHGRRQGRRPPWPHHRCLHRAC